MDNPFQPFLDQAGVVILDGALATELERRGADLHDPLWSAKILLDNPDLIRQVHLDYLLAGADVATSASYQATFAGFARLLAPAPSDLLSAESRARRARFTPSAGVGVPVGGVPAAETRESSVGLRASLPVCAASK